MSKTETHERAGAGTTEVGQTEVHEKLEKNALVVEKKSELVAVGDTKMSTELAQMFQEDMGVGRSTDPSDTLIPFLAIIQKGSPQINEEERGSYIEGAKVGMLFNTVTNKLWPGATGVEVIACGAEKKIVRWKPNRGGYVDSYAPDWQAMRKQGARRVQNAKGKFEILMPNGDILSDTAYNYVLVDGAPMVIGAASTALGDMRKWVYYRDNRRLGPGLGIAPIYGVRYQLSTYYKKNESGDWYGWRSADNGLLTDVELYGNARKFARAILAGEIQIGRPDFFDGEDEGQSGDYDEGIPV